VEQEFHWTFRVSKSMIIPADEKYKMLGNSTRLIRSAIRRIVTTDEDPIIEDGARGTRHKKLQNLDSMQP
jgi:hypothetical protein